MRTIQRFAVVLATLLILVGIGCTTDPIIPAGGVPVEPPVPDPGLDNLCPDGVISFQHQVLPILISSCAYSGCHDVASHAEGVILDSYEQVRREVKPGDPNDSELYESLLENGDDRMPPWPADRLSNDQITLIRTWIEQGAENTTCGAPCDAELSSFSADIFPILQNSCIGCHNANRTEGNVNLESYNLIIPYVDNGGSSLSDCRISQIEKWIQEGAQNN
jgi:mono/diheme cytochrome c family protein